MFHNKLTFDFVYFISLSYWIWWTSFKAIVTVISIHKIIYYFQLKKKKKNSRQQVEKLSRQIFIVCAKTIMFNMKAGKDIEIKIRILLVLCEISIFFLVTFFN